MTRDEALATFCAVFPEHGLDAAIDALLVPSKPPEYNEIIRAVSFDFNIAPDQLKQNYQSRTLKDAVHIIMWLLWSANVSYPQIGRLLHGRHHTTCMHGVRRVNTTPHLLERAGYILSVCKSSHSPPKDDPPCPNTERSIPTT